MAASRTSFPDLLRVFGRLKFRLLLNALRRSRRARIGMFVLSAALGVSMASFVTVLLDASRRPTGGARMSVAFTTLWVAWVGLPFLLGGVDDAVDPDRLAELPLRRRELAGGTLIAASIGLLPVATLGGLLCMVAVLGRSNPAAIPLLLGAAIGQFLLCLVGSRLLATVLIRASRSRRGRDLGVILAASVSSGLWMLTQAMPVVSPGTRHWITTALAWTPAGSLGRAAYDAMNGSPWGSFGRLCFAYGVVALMGWWWTVELAKSMGGRRSGALWQPRTGPGSRSASRAGSGSLRQVRSYGSGRIGVPVAEVARRARGPINHPVTVIVRKEIRYLFRSPYRRASLVVGCLFGAPFVLLQSTRVDPNTLPPVAVAPIALLFGIAISHNLLGLDASSLWLELGTGIRMRDLLLGRALAAGPTLILPVWVSAFLAVVVTRNATAVVPTIALSIVAAGVPLGVGALISVLVPFPVADDSSPLGNQSAMTGRGCLVGLVHAGGLLVSAVLLSPVLAFAMMRGSVDALTVACCAAWSVVVLGSGVWLGERFADRSPGALAETVLNGLR